MSQQPASPAERSADAPAWPVFEKGRRLLDCIEPIVFRPSGTFTHGYEVRLIGGRLTFVDRTGEPGGVLEERGLFWDGVTSILLDVDPIFRSGVAEFLQTVAGSISMAEPIGKLLTAMELELSREPSDEYYEDIKWPGRAERIRAYEGRAGERGADGEAA